MIANCVISVFVAAAELGKSARYGRHLFVEDLITQTLREFDLGARAGEAHFEIADTAINLRLKMTREIRNAGRFVFDRRQRGKALG